jgi:uncharacterized RDD family membrane protein YckC
MIDNATPFETPEGIRLQLRQAGLFPRFGAALIDALILGAIVIIPVSVVMSFSAGIGLALLFCVWWFYPVYFEVFRQGETPGKAAMGVRVVQIDGSPVGWRGSLLRNLLQTVDFLPSLGLLGMGMMMFHPRSRRVGDLAAGTMVVHRSDKARPRMTRRGQKPLPEVEPEVPPCRLRRDEERSLVDFAERQRILSRPRQEELAEILKPIHGAAGKEAVAALHRYAAAASGRKTEERR